MANVLMTQKDSIGDQRWGVDGQFILQLAGGAHRIEVVKPEYRAFSTEVQVRQGETLLLNVVLSKEKS